MVLNIHSLIVWHCRDCEVLVRSCDGAVSNASGMLHDTGMMVVWQGAYMEPEHFPVNGSFVEGCIGCNDRLVYCALG